MEYMKIDAEHINRAKPCFDCCGCVLFLIVGLWCFSAAIAAIGIPGISDTPTYTPNLMTLSLSHHFEKSLYSPPPPPVF
jgi:hypothetical protein